MDIQRVRTLTTGKLHTDIADVYEDIYLLVGEAGIVTHLIPNAIRALRPFLLRRFPDPRFWNVADVSRVVLAVPEAGAVSHGRRPG